MLNINMKDPRPLYAQVIDGIKEQVIKGVLKPGDQIPSVRQLAGTLTINPNTVSKAYQELERQNVIETVRGRGTFIAAIKVQQVSKEKLQAMKQSLKKVCVEWHYAGCLKEELIEEIEKNYTEFEGSENK